MKKVLTFLIFLLSFSGFAYNNSASVFVESFDSGGSGSGTQNFVINEYTQIDFRCTFTNGSQGSSSFSSGVAYLEHGGQLIDSFNYDGSVGSYSSTFTGQWYAMELTVNCSTNAIGLAYVVW